MDALVVIGILALILLSIRSLSQRWFPGIMRPVERLLTWIMRTAWGIVWAKPAKRWGGVNVAWTWCVLAVAAATIDALVRGRAEWSLAILWGIVGAVWWTLRVWNRWRLRPYRLPRRHRRGD